MKTSLLAIADTLSVRAQALKVSGDLSVGHDIDGGDRGNVALAGCDDPSTPFRTQPSVFNTGPTWERETAN